MDNWRYRFRITLKSQGTFQKYVTTNTEKNMGTSETTGNVSSYQLLLAFGISQVIFVLPCTAVHHYKHIWGMGASQNRINSILYKTEQD